jgi:hypothetical protein
MASIPPDGRARARVFAEAFEAASLWLGIAGTAGAPLLGPLAAPIAFSGALARLLAWKANRLAADPPDPAFEQNVASRALHLNLRVFPDDPASRALASLGRDMNRAQADLGATLRAFERAQGADRADAAAFVEMRLEDTRAWARRSVGVLEGLAASAQEAAELLDPQIEGVDPSGAVALQPEDLDTDVLAFLYVGGIPLETLKRGLEPTRMVGSDAAPPGFGTLIRPTLELANFLAAWAPSLRGAPEQ